MPKECNHNDHDHMFLWVAILLLCCNATCMDCTGEKTRQANDIRELQDKIRALETRP